MWCYTLTCTTGKASRQINTVNVNADIYQSSFYFFFAKEVNIAAPMHAVILAWTIIRSLFLTWFCFRTQITHWTIGNPTMYKILFVVQKSYKYKWRPYFREIKKFEACFHLFNLLLQPHGRIPVNPLHHASTCCPHPWRPPPTGPLEESPRSPLSGIFSSLQFICILLILQMHGKH